MNYSLYDMLSSDEEANVTFKKKLFYSSLELNSLKRLNPTYWKEELACKLINNHHAKVSITKIKKFFFKFHITCEITYGAAYLYKLISDAFSKNKLAFKEIRIKDGNLCIKLADEYFEDEKYHSDCVRACYLAGTLENDLKICIIIVRDF